MTSYMFSDPVTKFMEALHVTRELDSLAGGTETGLDFEAIQKYLIEAETLLNQDYVLAAEPEEGSPSIQSEFLRLARRSLVESFCKIHWCFECLSFPLLNE